MWLAVLVCAFHGLGSPPLLPPGGGGGNPCAGQFCNLGFFAWLWTLWEYSRRTTFCRCFCRSSKHSDLGDCSNTRRAKEIFGGRDRDVLYREGKERGGNSDPPRHCRIHGRPTAGGQVSTARKNFR